MESQQKTQLNTVIFDLGRVLVYYDHQVTLSSLAQISHLTTDEIAALHNSDLGEQMGRGEVDARQMHQIFVKSAESTASFDQYIKHYAAGIKRNEEALAYALSLNERPDLQIGIISNTNEAHAAWLHANLPELQHFDDVILSNEVSLIKPDPRIYQLALERLGADASQCIFVDDLSENVEAAQRLGMSGILHSDWAQTRPMLESWLEAT